MSGTGEFDLIARIRARAGHRDDVVLGIGDDAAVLRVPRDRELVVSMDTLNAGVHFPSDTAPADIGWKALAVNLSDLAAMGAEPAWCTLALSMPEPDARWLDAFLDGFFSVAAQHGVALIGGDTTRGPLSVCVTVHGLIEPGHALRRDGARVGDAVWVTGTLGDAAGALRQWRAGSGIDPALHARLRRPTPRVSVGRALGTIATACIDVSDGLLADLGHIAHASGVGIVVAIDDAPRSSALSDGFDERTRRELAASGGDDYELCFTAPAGAEALLSGIAEASRTRLTRIGRVVAGEGVAAFDATGAEWTSLRRGYAHFVE